MGQIVVTVVDRVAEHLKGHKVVQGNLDQNDGIRF